VARGDFRHRIRLVRRDEFGRLFASFNLMNGALQGREHRSATAALAALPEDISLPTRILPAVEGDEIS
jgi:eukaryotic-like serine/threonine-protein kinase